VRVAIYDPRGRLVRQLLDAPLAPGTHRLAWDGRDGRGRTLGSGVYLYAVQAGSARVSGKLTLLR
jgi:flagellar hook assembly protein FlgD